MVVVEAFRRDFGNGRASISYIKRATRTDDKTIIKTCRELANWGFVLRHVANGKVTEYVPASATTKPYPASTSGDFASSKNTSGDFTGGTSGDFTGGVAETSPVFSRESYLPSPAYSPADGISKSVSASGPDAEAPSVAGLDFERIWRAYGRYGNKQASKRAFDTITDPDADHMAQRAAAWASSAKPGRRRMPLERWLDAEKFDEADRSMRPSCSAPKRFTEEPEDAEVRRKRTDGEDAAEAAEAWSAIRRAAIEIDVPRNTSLTVRDATIEDRDGDTWLAMMTDVGTRGVAA
jgi:hypothetical protein